MSPDSSIIPPKIGINKTESANRTIEGLIITSIMELIMFT